MKKMKEYRRAISVDESLLTLAEPTESAGSRARRAHHSLEESTSIAIICFHCGESGHTEEKCINPAPSTSTVDFNCRRHDDGYTHGRYSGRGQNKFLNGRRCRGCAEFGHRMKDCPLFAGGEGRPRQRHYSYSTTDCPVKSGLPKGVQRTKSNCYKRINDKMFKG